MGTKRRKSGWAKTRKGGGKGDPAGSIGDNQLDIGVMKQFREGKMTRSGFKKEK